MPANFDFLIIETYTELIAVIAGAAILVMALRLLWRRRRAGVAKSRTSPKSKANKSTWSRPGRAAIVNKPLNGADFDKLATVITEANDRAGHLTDTQSAAALKLDSAEMAVIRLLADIDGIMTVPGKIKPAPAAPTASAPTAPLVRPLAKKPNLAA